MSWPDFLACIFTDRGSWVAGAARKGCVISYGRLWDFAQNRLAIARLGIAPFPGAATCPGKLHPSNHFCPYFGISPPSLCGLCNSHVRLSAVARERASLERGAVVDYKRMSKHLLILAAALLALAVTWVLSVTTNLFDWQLVPAPQERKLF